jgi:hypothetical protein
MIHTIAEGPASVPSASSRARPAKLARPISAIAIAATG